MSRIEAFAPAKINLTLHVTGQREDGYHLLESLVCFAMHGDLVTVEAAETLSLHIEGPFAAGLSAGADNLVLRAARLLDPRRGARITLTKRLPVSSGIGGGSADAAATLRALAALWDVALPAPADLAVLGADVPVCLRSGFARMTGIGDRLVPLGRAPDLALVLVNPGVAVSTPDVFRALARKDNAGMTPMPPVARGDAWLDWLAAQRNDLEAPAQGLAPVVGEVLSALRALPGCRLARMSGSGATCFALFDRDRAPAGLAERFPHWWVACTRVLPEEVVALAG